MTRSKNRHPSRKAAKAQWARFTASPALWGLLGRLESSWDEAIIQELLLLAKDATGKSFSGGAAALLGAIVSGMDPADTHFARASALKDICVANARAGKATHRQKRRLVKDLGFRNAARQVAGFVTVAPDGGLLVEQPADGSFEIIVRKRDRAPYRRAQVLVEEGDPATLPPGEVLLTERDYLTIRPDQSVIIISPEPSGDLPFTVELVVIRRVAMDSAAGPHLYAWLTAVVDAAVDERRDVRPNSEGKLVQVGLNLGPRHARVIGWAKSYTRRLDDVTMTIHDEDVIGAASFMWALLHSLLPAEIMGEVDPILDLEWMPHLATRNVPDGEGFSVVLDGHVYEFPKAKRGPPTTYLSRGYSAQVFYSHKTHVDGSYFNWCFSWTVSRILTQPSAIPGAGGKRGAAVMSKGPSDGGANFVDVTLGIVVKNAAATIMAFRPEHQHATTRCCGAVNRGLTNNFDEKPGKALEQLAGTGGIGRITARGGGNGHNTDVDE